MKKIYYWSPCLTKVGTHKSTLNSAISLKKYSKNDFEVCIINSCGEWEQYKKEYEENNIKVIDLNFNYFQFLPKEGFLCSRISNIIIFIFSFFSLLKLLLKNKPDYIILHLITSLPLLLMCMFNFETRFILRISGYPRLNLLRKFFWKISSKKIFKVTSPTQDLIFQIKEMNIFRSEQLYFLPDAIINIKNFLNKSLIDNKINNNLIKKKYFISAGRLTTQKNFNFLINEFYQFCKVDQSYNLLIFGEGEDKSKLLKQINLYNLEKKIFLMGYTNKLYYYLKNSEAFILSSLWEDPGFVLIEAAMCNTFIISSNCKNGPREFLNNGSSGMLFENNLKKELENMLIKYTSFKKDIFKKKVESKKNCLKYTSFRHSKALSHILI